MKKLIGIAVCSLVIFACQSNEKKKELQLERAYIVAQTKYNKDAIVSAKQNEISAQRTIDAVKDGTISKDTTESHDYVIRKRQLQDSLKKANDSMAIRLDEIDARLK